MRDELAGMAEPTRALAAEAGWAFGSVADLVLTHGSFYRPVADPPAVPHPTETTFTAAAYRARELHALYVEGYVLTRDGRVVPAAWPGTTDHTVLEPYPDHRAWLGVSLAEHARRRLTRRTGAACALHAQDLDRYRLLRHGLPTDARPV